jgi:hypothetical protein
LKLKSTRAGHTRAAKRGVVRAGAGGGFRAGVCFGGGGRPTIKVSGQLQHEQHTRNPTNASLGAPGSLQGGVAVACFGSLNKEQHQQQSHAEISSKQFTVS